MRYRGYAMLLPAVLALVASSAAGATYVLPVVVSQVEGLEGSFWESEIRILRLDPTEPVTVRRAWVALRGGGFVDNPATAPKWSLTPDTRDFASRRMLVLEGQMLLRGTGATHAAIGLEIEGAVKVMVRTANTENKMPPQGPGSPRVCLLGNGQLTFAATELIAGESYIPWISSTRSDSSAHPALFRTNLGFVNPTPSRLRLSVQIIGSADPYFGWFSEAGWTFQPTLKIDLPPWGWTQLNDVFAGLCVFEVPWRCSLPAVPLPSYARIVPEGDGPYLAYASVIYSPTNDPELVWAEQGSLGPLPPDVP